MPLAAVLKRSCAALLAAAFLFAVDTGAAGVRSCPHHERAPVDHSEPATPAGHADHAAADHDAPAVPEHEDGACTCMSSAQCGAATAWVAARAAAFAPSTPVLVWSALPLRHQAPARVPALFLPDATAPPAAL
jgi:hypothetical protein